MSILFPKEGYVYIIRCEHYYKIGVSKQIESRKWETDNPFPIEIIRVFPSQTMRRTEMRLHEMFRRFLHRGEWFVLTPACVAWFLTVDDIDEAASRWGHGPTQRLIEAF